MGAWEHEKPVLLTFFVISTAPFSMQFSSHIFPSFTLSPFLVVIPLAFVLCSFHFFHLLRPASSAAPSFVFPSFPPSVSLSRFVPSRLFFFPSRRTLPPLSSPFAPLPRCFFLPLCPPRPSSLDLQRPRPFRDGIALRDTRMDAEDDVILRDTRETSG